VGWMRQELDNGYAVRKRVPFALCKFPFIFKARTRKCVCFSGAFGYKITLDPTAVLRSEKIVDDMKKAEGCAENIVVKIVKSCRF